MKIYILTGKGQPVINAIGMVVHLDEAELRASMQEAGWFPSGRIFAVELPPNCCEPLPQAEEVQPFRLEEVKAEEIKP